MCVGTQVCMRARPCAQTPTRTLQREQGSPGTSPAGLLRGKGRCGFLMGFVPGAGGAAEGAEAAFIRRSPSQSPWGKQSGLCAGVGAHPSHPTCVVCGVVVGVADNNPVKKICAELRAPVFHALLCGVPHKILMRIAGLIGFIPHKPSHQGQMFSFEPGRRTDAANPGHTCRSPQANTRTRHH